ncbi:DUF4190 domain-containing protein [Corynebacterium lowii]|uniref:DUF4190 domain-containing protein n=1 Tax=Corynebacterium lowii TaxID=1544413 RepID=A0A0Q1AIK2_9CORY|nr:DUF4190 domain-containing protein [Corynebacterium lowii]KQB86529.1 hypothetical protein Clow_00737 [Corynebacterium lowii]MDP9851209.1 large-conductance mechanosensitive channel [Corynebacterium lowii]
MSGSQNPYENKQTEEHDPPLVAVPMEVDQSAAFAEPTPQAPVNPEEAWTVDAQERNKVAPWALGIGIASAALLLTLVLPIIVGLVGIVVGIIAVVKAKKNPTEGRRMGMSVVGLVLSVISFLISLVFVVGVAQSADEIQACVNTYPEGSAEQEQCIADNISVPFFS